MPGEVDPGTATTTTTTPGTTTLAMTMHGARPPPDTNEAENP